jgi:hypothetical protein
MTVFRIEYKNRRIGEFLELSKAMSFVDMALANPARIGIDYNAKRADLVLSSYEYVAQPLFTEAELLAFVKEIGADRVVSSDSSTGKAVLHFSSEKIQTEKGWWDEDRFEMVGEVFVDRPCDKEIAYIYDKYIGRFLELR